MPCKCVDCIILTVLMSFCLPSVVVRLVIVFFEVCVALQISNYLVSFMQLALMPNKRLLFVI